MERETVVNIIANCTTAFSALGLLIHIFGDPDNSVWDNKVKAWLAKLGLTVTTCGAISNVLTLSTPPITEVVLNCGISITFFWLNWWQYELFKSSQKKNKPVARRSYKKNKEDLEARRSYKKNKEDLKKTQKLGK